MKNLDNTATEEFLDTYEGEVMFVCDELVEYVARLDKHDINQALINQIADKVDEVANIFLCSTYTRHLSLIFVEGATFLRKMDLESLDTKNEGFFFLARIIDDMRVYIEKYFVKREFSDVYIFQESLMNSVEFMERAFEGEKEEGLSELEFFDD